MSKLKNYMKILFLGCFITSIHETHFDDNPIFNLGECQLLNIILSPQYNMSIYDKHHLCIFLSLQLSKAVLPPPVKKKIIHLAHTFLISSVKKVFLLVPDMVDIEEISYGETLHGVNSAYCAGAEIKKKEYLKKAKTSLVCVCVFTKQGDLKDETS